MRRNASIEALRVLAMVEIVAFHANPLHRLPVVGGLGLPIFLLLTGAFAVLGTARRGAREVIGAKVTHLGIGWVAWCAVYAVERAVLLRQPFELSMLLYGPSIHLWFVPFSIAACAICVSLHEFAARVPVRATAPALIALAAVPVPDMPSVPPLPQWGFALPAIPIGLALGQVVLSGSRAALVGTAAAGGLLALQNPRYGFALLLVSAAFALPTRGLRLLTVASPCMLGVYYVHAGIDRALRGHVSGYALIVIVFALSLAIAMVARHTRFGVLFSSERGTRHSSPGLPSSTPSASASMS